MPSQRFEDVEVWKLAHRWVLNIYKYSDPLPREERFGIRLQLRRAAIGLPANFAEGFKKHGHADKARYYNIAQASMEEARYYLILCRDLEYADPGSLLDDVDRIARMLDAYRRAMLSQGRRR